MFKVLCAALTALVLASCGGGGGAVDPIARTPVRLALLSASTSGALVESGFETGMAGWADWGNAQVVEGTGAGGSLRALRVGIAAGGAGYTVGGVTAGTTYQLTAQAMVSAPAENAYIGVYLLDAAGTKVAEQAVQVTGTAYALATVQITAPAGASSAVVYLWKNAGSGYAFVDEVRLAPAGGSSSPPPPTGDSTNLLSNPGFDAGMTSWVDWGNSSVDAVAPALRVGTGAGGAAQAVGGITGGASYRLSAQSKVSVASDRAYLGVYLLDAGGNKVAEQVVPITSTAFALATVDIVAPATATRAVAYVWKDAGSGYVFVDDVKLALVGGSAPPPPPPGDGANLLSNPGFEGAMAGWTDWGNTVVVTGQSSSGSYAARVGTAAGGFGQGVGSIVAGTTYRLSGAAKVSVSGEVVYLGVSFFDAAGTKLLEQNAYTSATLYATVRLDAVAPANAARALVYVWKNAGGGYAYVDDVVFASAAATAPDLVVNGGFENQLANWSRVSDDIYAPDATVVTDAGSGTYAVRVGVMGGVIQSVNLVPGQGYRLSAQGKVSDPSIWGYVGVMVSDASGAIVLDQQMPFYYTGTTGYGSASVDFTAPLNAAKNPNWPTDAMLVVEKMYGSGASGSFYADSISLVPLASSGAGNWDY